MISEDLNGVSGEQIFFLRGCAWFRVVRLRVP